MGARPYRSGVLALACFHILHRLAVKPEAWVKKQEYFLGVHHLGRGRFWPLVMVTQLCLVKTRIRRATNADRDDCTVLTNANKYQHIPICDCYSDPLCQPRQTLWRWVWKYLILIRIFHYSLGGFDTSHLLSAFNFT